MKKALSLLLTLVLSLSLCTGAFAAEDTHLIMAWWGNQSRNDTFNAILESYAAQHEGVTFDGQFVSWSDYWNKLATAAAGHTLPDFLLMDYAYMMQYVDNNLLADLTPYVESGILDLSQFDPGIVASATKDGRIYAVCSNINAPALLYNKTLLDENGLVAKDNMTMDEYIALCREIYEKTGYKTNFAFGANQMMDYVLRGVGHNLFTNGKLSATVEDFELFFGYYEQGMKEGWMLPSDVYAEIDISSIEQSPVVYGTDPSRMSWCTFLWSNQLSAMQSAAPEGVEIGLTTWPSANPGASNYLKPGGFFAVTVDSKNPEEACKVVNFFANDLEAGKMQALIGSNLPAKNVAAAALPYLNEVTQKGVAYLNDVVSPNCSMLPEAEPVGANEFFAKVLELEEMLCYGMTNAKDAAAELMAVAEPLFNK